MDTEIRSLLSASFLDAIPVDARLIDKQLLAEAHEMVVAEPEIYRLKLTSLGYAIDVATYTSSIIVCVRVVPIV